MRRASSSPERIRTGRGEREMREELLAAWRRAAVATARRGGWGWGREERRREKERRVEREREMEEDEREEEEEERERWTGEERRRMGRRRGEGVV